MAAENNNSPSTLQQYLGYTTTRKRFEPGHNLFTFPLVHSAKSSPFIHRMLAVINIPKYYVSFNVVPRSTMNTNGETEN